MSISGVILAAGRSTRLKSHLPKPLHEVCGRPMLDHILRACYDAGCRQVMVVIGHGKDEIMAEFAGDGRIIWVEQSEQLGTGHAARMCEPELKRLKGDVFILTADGPLIRGQVLRTLLQVHREEAADASMATAVLDDPTGYGRIIRDQQGNFLDIIEQPDATEQQRAIREIFPSYYCVKAEALLWALPKLKNDNKKGEYYLTDIYGILRGAGRKVVAVQAVAAEDTLAVNTRQELAVVDAMMQERIQRQLREAGVTIVSGDSTYIESGVSVGPDTTIRPFSFIGRDSTIGSNCTIGPFAHIPRESIVPEGTVVENGLAAEA